MRTSPWWVLDWVIDTVDLVKVFDVLVTGTRDRPTDLIEGILAATSLLLLWALGSDILTLRALCACTITISNFGFQNFGCAMGSVLSLADPDCTLTLTLILLIVVLIIGGFLLKSTVEVILLEGLNKDFLLLAGKISRISTNVLLYLRCCLLVFSK